MQLSLEQRLLRFLAREERDEQRQSRELRAQPVAQRVIEGECIENAAFVAERDGSFHFAVADNTSKFRPGDTLVVGDGLDIDGGSPLVCGAYDAGQGVLRLERDPFARGVTVELEPGASYVIDRRPLGLQGRLRDAVRAAFAWPQLAAVLRGEHALAEDAGRKQRALAKLAELGLNAAQVEAGAAAIATQSLALVQGPPGTGKTRLLAEVVALLAGAGCRIALCAFTHRAVDNALLAIRRCAPDLPLVKLNSSSGDSRELLRDSGVQLVDARRARLPDKGVVVGSTCFQLAKLGDKEQFHLTVFDESGQLPVPHALPGMLRAQRWLFFGDHRQLPPVVTTSHADPEVAVSIFELLHRHYGSHLLDTTYRMNRGVCSVVSETFYEGRVHAAEVAAARVMPFNAGGRFDEVLAPQVPVVWLRVDHRQPGQRSSEEANAIAELVDELVRRHGVAPKDIAVIAPFRAQVRLLRSSIEQRSLPHGEDLVVDTVERIQGQEREVVVVSLTAGDPHASRGRGAFHLSLNRLNVALSRARTKAVLVASAHAFSALPHDPEGLRMASRCKELRDRLPSVDLTRLYVVS
ncbi:MAG: AAA family ATPase [Planctomycetes bacterium]|nr:AAA family ATPase [Planctomycetota bacterium]MCB9884602.1 AAA family ATPase [Planctomycetota bacterium]